MHPDFDEVMTSADVDYRTRCRTDAGFAAKFRIPPTVDPVRTFREHSNSVDAVCWGPDSGCLVSGSHDGTLKVWDARTGACTDTLTGHTGGVYHCAVSNNRQIVVSCGSGPSSNVLVWRWPMKKVAQTLSGHRRAVVHVALSGDGLSASTADQDGIVVVHDLARSQLMMQRALHLGTVHGTSFCREDANLLLTAGHDGRMHLLDLREQVLPQAWLLPSVAANCVSLQTSLSIPAAHDGHAVYAVEFVGRHTVLSGGADNKLKRWDLRSTGHWAPRCCAEYLGHTAPVRCLAVSGDGRLAVSGCEDGSSRVWRTDARGEARAAIKDARHRLHAAESQAEDESLSAEARRDHGSRRAELRATLADQRSREEQLARDGHASAVRALTGHVSLVSCVAWKDEADGSSVSVLSSSWDQTVQLFELSAADLE